MKRRLKRRLERGLERLRLEARCGWPERAGRSDNVLPRQLDGRYWQIRIYGRHHPRTATPGLRVSGRFGLARFDAKIFAPLTAAAITAIAAIAATALLADIDPLAVAGRHRVVRHVAVARRQRQPTHSRAVDAHADAHAVARPPASPGHQGRRVDRPRDVGPGHPAPGVTPVGPAAVVEGCEAPTRVIHPGPAPGLHPGPAAVAVRRPTGAHGQRQPHRAVFGVLFPAAVAVQLFDAGHLGRHIARRSAALVPLVFTQDGFGIAVADRYAHPETQRVRTPFAGQLDALAGGDDETRRVVDAQFAAPAAGLGGVVVAVQPEVACSQRCEACLGSDQVDFIGNLARAHPQRQVAAVQLESQPFVVQPQHLDLGGGAQAQHCRADAQFGTAAHGSADAVASGQRLVAIGFTPTAGLLVPPRHRTAQISQPAHSARRVGLGPSGRGPQAQAKDHQQAGQPDRQGRTPGAARVVEGGVHRCLTAASPLPPTRRAVKDCVAV